MTIDINSIIDDARELSDLPDTSTDAFVSPATWTKWVNQGAESLFRIMSTLFADLFVTTFDFTLTGGVGGNFVTLPSDFRELTGLDYNPDTGNTSTVERFNMISRNNITGNRWLQFVYPFDTIRKYRIIGSKLYVEPQQNSAGNYRIWYVANTGFIQVPNINVTLATISPLTPAPWAPLINNLIQAPGFGLLNVNGTDITNFTQTILVKDEVDTRNNGLFVSAAIGSPSVPSVLSRFSTGWQHGNPIPTGTIIQTNNDESLYIVTTQGVIETNPIIISPYYPVLDPSLEPYAEYISIFAAIKALTKEESSTSELRVRLQGLVAEIELAASTRDSAFPNTGSDVGWSNDQW